MVLIKRLVPHAKNFSRAAAQGVLRIGDTLTLTRIFTNEDVADYAKVSYDSNTLHFNAESARNAGFEDCLVHGMLVASLFPRIISSQFPGAVYVSQSLHFKVPVYIGEEILGEVTAVNIKENKKRFICISIAKLVPFLSDISAKFTTKCYKNGEQAVVDGEATTILPTLDTKGTHSVN